MQDCFFSVAHYFLLLMALVRPIVRPDCAPTVAAFFEKSENAIANAMGVTPLAFIDLLQAKGSFSSESSPYEIIDAICSETGFSTMVESIYSAYLQLALTAINNEGDEAAHRRAQLQKEVGITQQESTLSGAELESFRGSILTHAENEALYARILGHK